MAVEPRGFAYQLEPLQRKSDWELQALQQALAHCHGELLEQQVLLEQIEDLLKQAVAEHLQQQGPMQVIHIERQRNVHDYLTQLGQQVAHAKEGLLRLEQQRDQILEDLHKQQKIIDGLAEHRKEELKDYIQLTGKADITESDDAWLRGASWRKKQ